MLRWCGIAFVVALHACSGDRDASNTPPEDPTSSTAAEPAPDEADACPRLCEGPLSTREALRAALGRAMVARHAAEPLDCSEHGEDVGWGVERDGAVVGPVLEAHLSEFHHGICASAPDRSLAVVETRLARGWSGCAIVEAEGGVNDRVGLPERDALRVRGSAIEAHVLILNHDREALGDCNECLFTAEDDGENTSECDELCEEVDRETARTVRLDASGVRLRITEGACLGAR